MKTIIACFLIYLLYSPLAFSKVEYLPITENLELPDANKLVECSIGSVHLYVKGPRISIEALNNRTLIELNEILDAGELIVGDMTGDGFCDFAVPYAKSDVNESYKVFLYHSAQEKVTGSNISTITNPEFQAKKIISTYRGAARWSKEKLCYSENLNDFFICEKKTEINESLESFFTCTEKGCSPPTIIHKSNSSQAFAIVTGKQAKLHDKLDNDILIERRGYLVAGDKVRLLDFFQGHDDFFYKVVYLGSKTEAVGWIRAIQLRILPDS